MRKETTACCIVGGGPAGMMAGLLLARQGVDVMVLEKHEDFLRDFRGDTIHPATLQLLDELGAIDEFLALPHTKMERVTMDTPSGPVTFADFTRLAGRYGYIAFLPQWDFLNFLVGKARRYPSFRLLLGATVTDLIEDDGRIVGVRASTTDGPLDIRARLVLAADGRHSTVREQAGLDVIAHSPPMDVLWFRISRRPEERVPFFRKQRNMVLITIDRGEYWQLAYVIPHQGFESVQEQGLPAFRAAVAEVAPSLADRVEELTDWDRVKLLSVRVDRLRRWYRRGVLCIGDAAHAMSPAGGVGINLAIQDAVAAANILGPAFRSGGPTDRDLRRVQRRRELPTRVVQAFQVKVLRDLYPSERNQQLGEVDRRTKEAEGDPLAFRLAAKVPALRHLAGRFIGVGIRPEHIGGHIRAGRLRSVGSRRDRQRETSREPAAQEEHLNWMANPATSGSGLRSGFPTVEDGASLHEIRRVEASGEELIDRAYDVGGIGSFPRFVRQESELHGGSQLGHAHFHLGGNLESSWYHRSALIWVFAVENAIPLVLGNPGLKRWLPGGLSDRLLEVAEPVGGMGSAWLALVMFAGMAAVPAGAALAATKTADVH